MNTKDGFPIEHAMHDGNHPPMPPGEVYKGQRVNTNYLWIRLPGDDWYRVQFSRSAWSITAKVGVLDLIELKALVAGNML
jgi:hypothetical protein